MDQILRQENIAVTNSTINKQVENVLEMIRSGKFNAAQLVNLYDNVNSHKDVTDQQREDVVEAIEIQLWATKASSAKRIFGARNRDTHEKLQVFLNELQTRHDLSENQHKTKVKVGGKVLKGEAIVYDYISYRNSDTRMIAHMAFRRIEEKDTLEISVRRGHVKDQYSSREQETLFKEHEFSAACETFEVYLTEVLQGYTP